MPELPETATEATETGEKMIPLSAVAPLLGWAYGELRDRGGAGVPGLLIAAYDHAAERLNMTRAEPLLLHFPRRALGTLSSIVQGDITGRDTRPCSSDLPPARQ